MPDLSAARAKLERAHKHIQDFDRERVAFLATDPYAFIPEFNAESGITTYRFGPMPVFPAILSLLIGDAAHNLRTALDFVIHALVVETGETPGIVNFPIAKTAGEYPAESRRKTKGMPEWARKKLDAIKPYEGGDNLLWGVHELDRIDKHRLLIGVITFGSGMTVGTVDKPIELRSLVYISDAKEGNALAEINGRPETHKGIRFTAGIALGEPAVLAGEAVTKTLRDMALRIDQVIKLFER